MFSARLGLAVAALCDGHEPQQAVIDKVTSIATGTGDAYVAREVLASPSAALLTPTSRAALRATVRDAGLGHPLPATQLHQLTSSAATAEAALAASLAPARTPPTADESLPEDQSQ
jgi:hypothetical protein